MTFPPIRCVSRLLSPPASHTKLEAATNVSDMNLPMTSVDNGFIKTVNTKEEKYANLDLLWNSVFFHTMSTHIINKYMSNCFVFILKLDIFKIHISYLTASKTHADSFRLRRKGATLNLNATLNYNLNASTLSVN